MRELTNSIAVKDSKGNVLVTLSRNVGFHEPALLTDAKGRVRNDAQGRPVRFYSTVPEPIIEPGHFGIDFKGEPYYEPGGAPWGEVARLYVIPATDEMFVKLEPDGDRVPLRIVDGCIRLDRRPRRVR